MHALVTVLLPRDGSRDLEDLMAPYDMNVAVAPYPTECFCQQQARILAGISAGKAGGIDEIRRAYQAIPVGDRPGWTEYPPAAAVLAEIRQAEAAVQLAPQADCADCQGTGRYFAYFNPDSRWDYYRPLDELLDDWDAARWPKALTQEPGDYVTHSLLLPDLGWCENGDVGWLMAPDGESWDDLFRATLRRYLDTGTYDVVVCDYHW